MENRSTVAKLLNRLRVAAADAQVAWDHENESDYRAAMVQVSDALLTLTELDIETTVRAAARGGRPKKGGS